MMDDGERGAVGGMSDRGNRSTLIKRATMSLCSPQIPHDLSWDRTRAAPGSRRLTNRLSYRSASFSFVAVKPRIHTVSGRE
jgi:hypothetical protein